MTHICLLILLLIICSLLLYTWMLFPAALLLLATRDKHKQRLQFATHCTPHVSIIISAHNEESVICQRLRNIETLEYPHNLLTVLIGTDGCNDNTASLVRSRLNKTDFTLQLHAFDINRGKTSVIADLVLKAIHTHGTQADHVLVFSDANTIFAPDAITKLVAPFADQNIGGVCGGLHFLAQREQPEQQYWSIESRLKDVESRYDSCLGANGAIYAIRPSLFWHEIPRQTILDDFVIGMKVREAGRRMYFEPDAIAFEDLPERQHEWKRRVRIGSGAFQALLACRKCLHPDFKCFALFFWSHKVLRWFTPHLYIAACILSAGHLVTVSRMSMIHAILPIAFLASLAACPAIHYTSRYHAKIRQRHASGKLLAGLDHFIMMQAALFTGFLLFCKGNLSGTWETTPRQRQPGDHA
jgi:cellulose synthase/poly-beta-1,6-N-acetylglucosamine synthase-like glycosyltransferase